MITLKSISLICPSRNNLKYLKHAYESVRKNIGFDVEFCVADDASSDGTHEWCIKTETLDENFKFMRNYGPERLGHCILYDELIQNCATRPVVGVFHADMYMAPNALDYVIKNINRGVVISLTRVEPSIHPPGNEKVTLDFGMEPEGFKESEFLKKCSEMIKVNENSVTEGIFAPWFLYREDFLSIGGHDKKLFAPMELEDSDIFNRFLLKGYKFIQSRSSFVYHFTCRGSRFKDGIEIERIIDLPDGSKWYKPKDSQEYLKLRQQKFREWWRKWHSDVLHDQLLKPIVYPRYDTRFHIKGKDVPMNIISFLEPWCDSMSFDYAPPKELEGYIRSEDTKFNLEEKFSGNPCDITVEFDWRGFSDKHVEFIKNLPLMISDVGEVGIYEFDIFKIEVNKIEDYSKLLIKNEDFYRWKSIKV